MHQFHWEAIERVKKRTDEPTIDAIIDVAEIVKTHNKIIRKYGGEKGILNRSELEFATGWVRSHPKKSVIWKAAILIRGIVCGHPFVDGNKRTGLAITEALLDCYGYELVAPSDEVKEFVLSVAIEGWSVDRIVAWLKANVAKKR
ncbi:MAG: hypothetical protein PWR26_747 [Methanosarcinales archaeon]|nr:hypothetical protein [Methanosarcinales archaeon]MDN5295651.1 hypothetical protein [Methanosarcinales archaeon]